MALSSLTAEIATLTSSAPPAASSKSNTPTSARPSICARARGSLSAGGGKPL